MASIVIFLAGYSLRRQDRSILPALVANHSASFGSSCLLKCTCNMEPICQIYTRQGKVEGWVVIVPMQNDNGDHFAF